MIAVVLLLAFGAAPAELPARMPEVCLEDLQRFPSEECVRRNWELAVVHQEQIRQQYDATGGVACREWLADAERRLAIWWSLYSVHILQGEDGACGYEYSQLHTLRQLREDLGPAAYYRGEMPDAVPVWSAQKF